VAGAALLTLLATGFSLSLTGRSEAGPAVPAPNVVVVMTDDQTLESMRVMDRVNARVGDAGAEFRQSFVNYPLCCPSRATFLTGQYANNHRVYDNALPQGGYTKLKDANTLPVWLQRRGYVTGHMGKYLNGYGGDLPTYVPPGWSEWRAPIVPTVDDVYDYGTNQNGVILDYGDSAADYKQDVITNWALDFISRRAPNRQPFFLFVGYTAPHGAGPDPNPQPPSSCGGMAPKPAPRHAALFTSEPLPQPPNFNEADVLDKPSEIRDRPPLSQQMIEQITQAYRCSLAELQSVDEGVGQMLDSLESLGELENTYFIYTSDNGFFNGEHRVPQGKKRVYEEAIRVPLMIRGPGIPPGVKVDDMVVNADLAPTILELTGAHANLPQDGRSLLPAIAAPNDLSGRELLIESNRWAAVRTFRYTYSENADGSQELYDLQNDPFQLTSVHDDPAYREALTALQARLRRLRRCQGPDCTKVPRVELQLSYEGGDGGRLSCATAPVKAMLERHGEAVESVRFAVGRRELERVRPPFARKLPFGELSRRRNAKVKVTVDLVDGRRQTLEARVRTCRR
jgi:arylsulfatase A-like enzyme